MSMTLYEAINQLYDGIFPDCIDEENTDEDVFAVHVDSAMLLYGTPRPVKITIEDVLEYYLIYRANSMASVRSLAGITGECKYMDDLAQEAFDWFKCVNREKLSRRAGRLGMIIDPRGD